MTYRFAPPAPERFVRTSVAEQIAQARDFALAMNAPVLVVGPPGIGKTTALTWLAERDELACYATVSNTQRTVKTLLKLVSGAFGWADDRQYARDLGDILHSQMPHAVARGAYLLLDEVQTLDLNALRELLTFNDLHGLPIVLSGNQAALKRTRVEAYAYEQIRDRLWKVVEITAPEADDFVRIGVEHDVEGADAYEALVAFGKSSSIRRTSHLLAAARHLAGPTGSIRLAHLEQAAVFLTGDPGVVSRLERKSSADVVPLAPGRPGKRV